MKKIFLVLAVLSLLQGCCSYKKVEINPNTMAIGQTYKIERNHKTSKVVYTRNADSAIMVLKHGREERIPLKEINSVREQKFSVAKTAALFPIVVVGLSIIFLYGGS